MRNKILWLVTGAIDTPKTGGEIYAGNVIEHLHSAGWDMDFLALTDAPRWLRWNYFLANLWFFIRVALMRRVPSLIVEDGYAHPWLFLCNWCLRTLLGARIVVFNQLFYFYREVGSITNAVDRLVTKLCFIPARLIITNSRWMEEETVRLGLSRTRIGYARPGCDLPRLRFPLSGRSPDVVQMICVSNYRPHKGQDILLDALHILLQNHPQLTDSFKVVCAGRYAGFESYYKRLQEKVGNYGLSRVLSLQGPTARTKLPNLLSSSDIFVLPTLNEGYGMVAAEAMCFGLPIICTDLPVLRELVEDGVNGILVPPRDPQAFADAIAALLKDPDLRRRMGEASLRKSQDRELVPTWQDTCREFEKVLRGHL